MVVNIYHKVPYDVYIGRAGKGQSGYFGNPIKKNVTCPECSKVHTSPGETLGCYERYARRRLEEDNEFRQMVEQLHGKVLGWYGGVDDRF